MKKIFFLIIALPILSFFLNMYTPVRAQKVNISAYVPEHLTYFRNGDKLTVSTNLPRGFILVTPEKTIQFFEPIEKSFELHSSFYLITNF